LTLKEAKLLLELARKGKNPLPHDFQRAYSTSAALACSRSGELCCLIEGLPNPGNGGRNAKTVRARNYATGNAGSPRRCTYVDGVPTVQPCPLCH